MSCVIIKNHNLNLLLTKEVTIRLFGRKANLEQFDLSKETLGRITGRFFCPSRNLMAIYWPKGMQVADAVQGLRGAWMKKYVNNTSESIRLCPEPAVNFDRDRLFIVNGLVSPDVATRRMSPKNVILLPGKNWMTMTPYIALWIMTKMTNRILDRKTATDLPTVNHNGLIGSVGTGWDGRIDLSFHSPDVVHPQSGPREMIEVPLLKSRRKR